MTIHFHTKHFEESGLPILEYMMLMYYEIKTDYQVRELEFLLSLCERTVIRMRQNLIARGYLKKTSNTDFTLTDLLYPKTKV